MEVVKAFNNELSSLYEARPPISKAKMTAITRSAIKAIKFYKHVVQSVEKFIQKCKSEYKVPGLYVIDSIVRQSRHQFTAEKDVFAPRFARNIQQTFLQLFNCPQEDKGKIVRVLNLWQKNQVFTPDVIQPLLDMASLANKDQLVVPPSSNGVQMPPGSTQPRTPTTKPSPVKDPSWLTSSVDISNTSAQPVPTPSSITSKLQSSTGVIDPNIMQQLQNLQNLLLDKQHEANSLQIKKDDTVKFDKKLLDFDYDEDDDDTPSPQQHAQTTPPLPSIDSLQTILSNPEVLRQLQTLQQQMSDMEDKMRRLKEMRHQEEEFDKHLAQTLPNLPFASECDFKPSSTSNITDGMSPGPLSAPPQPPQPPQSLNHPDSVSSVNFTGPVTAPPTPFGVVVGDSDERPQTSDFDERSRANIVAVGGNIGIGITSSDDTSWDPKLGNTQSSSDGPIEIIDLIRTESPAKSPSRGSRRRRSPSPRRSSRRSKSRSRSRSRRRRSRTRTRSRSRSRSRSKSREDRERERERRRRGLPPLKKNHLVVCSTTLWIGHLSKLVQQEELSDTFGEFGDIVSINLIPPRGCAFICMNRRQDAAKALQQLRHFKLQGKAITIAWAPGKGMKDKEWKDYWEVEHGVSYIPWNKLSINTDLEMLEDGGVIDEESLPEFLKAVKREAIKHDYANQMQQSQMHMMKGPDDKDELTINDHKTRNDMDVGGIANAPGVPPAFIPLPDNSMGGATAPTAQPPPGIPPMGLIPPFALPPRLLGPMGPMGPLGMGNVPLGVPPPLMMPPPPQQMVGRLPPPFNPPPQMGLMPPPNMGSGDGMDKTKISQIPPPPTPETFPNLSSMVNPFGITLPTLPSFPNTNILQQAQPPVSQPAINKMPTPMDLDVHDSKEEIKEVKPPITNASELPSPAASLSEIGNSSHNDRILRKDVERGNSDVGIAAGGSGGIGLGRKDCDWRETSPRRRDRMEREEKRRRRESPPPRRDERRDDRRGNDERRCDDRRTDERRGGTDRRGSSSRWQSRQNKWHEDNERHDNKSSSNSYKDSFGNGRPDKDERPSLLPLPDHFHGGPLLHHDHFKQNAMSHHEQYQAGLPNKPHSHHDQQHYQKGSLLGPHEQQYQQGPPKGAHHEHYQQGLLPAPHEQQYQQGPMPPHYRQQHDQHDQHFQQSPPMGYGGGGRYPESERDEMMGSNSDYGHPRGYFNRGHARLPARSPRPLLRTPNGPMFGPRGPPMGGPPMGGPPCPPPIPLRGHRPGPPGNRMDGPGFMPPRGFPPPGIRGRGGGGRFSGGVGRDEWETPQRRRGWEEYPPPPNHGGPHLGHGNHPSHLGQHPGPKSLLGTPGGHSGGPPSLLGSPGHLRLSSPSSNMERRKSRWSTNTENKSEGQQNQLDESSTPPPVNISEEVISENIAESIIDQESKINEQNKSNISDEMIPPVVQTSFELQESTFDEPQTEPDPLASFEPQEAFDQQSTFEHSNTLENQAPSSYELSCENSIQEEKQIFQPINESQQLSNDDNATELCQNNNHTPNLYEDEILPITFEPQSSQRSFDQINLQENDESCSIQSINPNSVAVEIKDDAPIFEIEENIEDVNVKEEAALEE